MLYEYEGDYYESLSLAVATPRPGGREAGGRISRRLEGGKGLLGDGVAAVGARKIPVDENVQSLIPFRGRQGSFPYVSATDVISGTADPEVLKDRIVLVGTTAKGLFDLRATPVHPAYPGVEAHANLIIGIIDGDLKENPAYTIGAEVVLLALSGIIMAVILPIPEPLKAAATTVALLLGIIGITSASGRCWISCFRLRLACWQCW